MYDYFGVKTRVWVTNDLGLVNGIQTKYELPYSSDHLLETGPDSQSNVGSLSVDVGFGSDGPSGSIGYSVDLSDTRPSIERAEDYTNDIVEWEMTPRFPFPIYLDGDSLYCCATWASKGTSLAGIDLYYNGSVNAGIAYPETDGYTKYSVRFNY